MHAQGIKSADHAALGLNGVYNEHRDHIAQQRQDNHTRGDAGIFVDDDVVRGPADAGVILRGGEAAQIGEILGKVFIRDLPHGVTHLAGLVGGSFGGIQLLRQIRPNRHEFVPGHGPVHVGERFGELPVPVGELVRAAEKVVAFSPGLLPVFPEIGIAHFFRVEAELLELFAQPALAHGAV